jgi:hypothetical protein
VVLWPSANSPNARTVVNVNRICLMVHSWIEIGHQQANYEDLLQAREGEPC